MGFASGFTGGVTLTLSLAYLSVLANQRIREEQSRSLRAQALALQTIVSPLPPALPRSRSETAAAQREASIEGAKDRWNDEVEKAVRWMQMTDWTAVREGLEAHVAALWTQVFGRGADEAEALAKTAKSTAGEAGGSISAAAKGAFERVKEARARAESTVQDKAAEAKRAGGRAAAEAEAEAKNKAAGVQQAMASALEKGRDRAQAVVGKVKTAVGMAEDDAAAAAAATTTATAVGGAKGQSAVERALQQRFEGGNGKAARNVAEVLKERYTPMDKRDNTVLRGL